MRFWTSILALTCGTALLASAQELQKKQNRLAKEKSPYLLLHADNPVDWYPWGKEAFAKARKENKPILLSIGYSTCHWCHVMERESFQNKELAAYINKHFVAVKLDREERPDVDQLYMTTYQAMTGQGGGWPLNVFLTPELKMFTGGTYFPPKSRGRRVGFDSVLKQIHEAWAKDSDKIKKDVDESYLMFAKAVKDGAVPVKGAGEGAISRAAANLMKTFDGDQGGWNPKGPKFPQPSKLRLLLLEWKKTKDAKLLAAVELTAVKMAHGGMYDHLAGGFHRYSVDGKWLVPHFEKMLYDQAQLLDFYAELWQITKNPEYKRVALDIADYVIKEMQHKNGGYFCAQDAQSEGKEGKFACWSMAELNALLTVNELVVVVKHFGITQKGNFFDFSDPKALKEQNVLSLPNARGLETGVNAELLKSAVNKMRAARAKRVPAATDDKVLASWNGLMIGAMARASVIFDKPEYLTSAKMSYTAIRSQLWRKETGELFHRWRDGERDETQQVSSYLWMVHGSRSLYQATLDPEYLAFALTLAGKASAVFADEKNGGFFESAKSEDIVLRLKADYDGAIPVATSVAAFEYSVLAEITGDDKLKKIGTGCIESQGAVLGESPEALCYLLRSVYRQQSKKPKLVIAGDPGKGTNALLHTAAQTYQPSVVISGNQGEGVSQFTQSLPAKDGKATAYYCLGKLCKEPVTEPKDLADLLEMQR